MGTFKNADAQALARTIKSGFLEHGPKMLVFGKRFPSDSKVQPG